MLNDYTNFIKNQDIKTILEKIIVACKMVSYEVEKSQIYSLHSEISSYGSHVTNYHGDIVKKLDIVSNDIFIQNLSKIPDQVSTIISEENNEPLIVNESAPYLISIDPLDGSSNIEACVSIGSIFGIYSIDRNSNKNTIIASGYTIYSSSTIFVLCYENKVNSFVLDKTIGEFIKHRTNIQIPKYVKIFSVNYGLYNSLDSVNKQILDTCVNKNYSMRYIGSMVADVHRTLLYGGIFMYPGTNTNKKGKLRYYYEVLPLSYLIVCAGGDATILVDDDGYKKINVDKYVTTNYHDTVPIYLGSSNTLNELLQNISV